MVLDRVGRGIAENSTQWPSLFGRQLYTILNGTTFTIIFSGVLSILDFSWVRESQALWLYSNDSQIYSRSVSVK